MHLISELIVGTVVAVVIYNILHHFLVVIPNRRHQQQTKTFVDQVVYTSLRRLSQQTKGAVAAKPQSSRVLSSVWGRGVMVFEYRYQLQDTNSLDVLQPAIKNQIEQVAKDNGLINHKHDSRLLVTDCWQQADVLVFNVADVKNNATTEFIHDLKKIDEK
ncbi:hypothetical protein [Fructilactobacillus florum]|uniref:Uncharacterized protein n=1 Tax=Fructilactobacillus florum DSM 22689 = JCM 16035 TaxID=1423745 RepID=A0A0R2CJZ8_9LACO|nr:hypothetical protein [Fructilactobacillus florum]KRM91669.1 hypothetical protein FC87_GL000806 [Fructilactobacillus florum DSM 22689 = JCM 16035]